MSGTAITPPELVWTPVPSRRNHASIVNAALRRSGEPGMATYALIPSKSTALLASTVTRRSSKLLNSPSLAVTRSTYTPGAEKVAVVDTAEGSTKVTAPGPRTLVQVVVLSAPGRPSSTIVPASNATVPRAIV